MPISGLLFTAVFMIISFHKFTATGLIFKEDRYENAPTVCTLTRRLGLDPDTLKLIGIFFSIRLYCTPKL